MSKHLFCRQSFSHKTKFLSLKQSTAEINWDPSVQATVKHSYFSNSFAFERVKHSGLFKGVNL